MEERNLSLTRILNGCAEARTVGTHYSTTHSPPLRQRILSPSPLPVFSFPLLASSVPRVFSLSLSLSSFREVLLRAIVPLALSLSLFLSYPGPLPSSSLGGWFFPLTPPWVPFSTPPSFSCVHPALAVKLLLRNCMCAAHTCSILFSFCLSFHLLPLFLSSSVSMSLSPSFLVKHNPRM